MLEEEVGDSMNTDLFVWLKPWVGRGTTADYIKLSADPSAAPRAVMRPQGGYSVSHVWGWGLFYDLFQKRERKGKGAMKAARVIFIQPALGLQRRHGMHNE